MHHIAYKLMRKPNNGNRRKARNNELSRSPSPPYSEQALQDREEITRLKIENEKLKESLECRENEVDTLKEEVQRLEDSLRSVAQGSDNQESTESEETENFDVEKNGVLCHRNTSHEVVIVREALSSLRQCFSSTDPHQHTIDTVEQSLSSMAERVADSQKRTEGHLNSNLLRGNGFGMDSCSDFHGSYLSSSFGLPVSPVDINNSFSTRGATKLVYYTSKSSTPFVSVIHKRLGEITLRDLKSSLDRPGLYRYHFKTLDPDYGMVKEEVVHDDDIIPGWDDRIVAWIEKVDE